MGGRGIGNTIKDVLINPLSRALFENNITSGHTVTVESIAEDSNG